MILHQNSSHYQLSPEDANKIKLEDLFIKSIQTSIDSGGSEISQPDA